MNVNCVNIRRRSLNITNINLLIFTNIKEIHPSVTQVLNIPLTTLAISASVQRADFKGRIA